MACRYDEPEPTERERMLETTATLLLEVNKRLGIISPNPISPTIKLVPQLCATLRKLQKNNPEGFDALVYNARDKFSRKLADWWEVHEAADAKRMVEEKAQAERDKLRKQALEKLTPEERAALGIKE